MEKIEELKILKPFENQTKILNDLLLFTRPDILANKEDIFIKLYVENELEKLDLDQNQKNSVINNLKDNLKKYYEQAKNLQKDQGFNCIDSKNNSIAKKLMDVTLFLKNLMILISKIIL